MNLRIGIAVLLISLGIVVIGIAILGLFRLSDVLERVQAGALMDTLGLLLVLGGVALLCGVGVYAAKLLVLLVILFIANPISSHLIVRMDLITGHDLEPDQLTGEGEQEL